jgi:hypothetical protein
MPLFAMPAVVLAAGKQEKSVFISRASPWTGNA